MNYLQHLLESLINGMEFALKALIFVIITVLVIRGLLCII